MGMIAYTGQLLDILQQVCGEATDWVSDISVRCTGPSVQRSKRASMTVWNGDH